jgi:hypothetical protein
MNVTDNAKSARITDALLNWESEPPAGEGRKGGGNAVSEAGGRAPAVRGRGAGPAPPRLRPPTHRPPTHPPA